MSQLIEIFDNTIKNNPELDVEDVTNIIINTFAEELPKQLAKQDIPEKNIRYRIIQERAKRFKGPKKLKEEEAIRQINKETENDLSHSLNLIKEEIIEDYVPFNPENFQHPHMFGKLILENLITSTKDFGVQQNYFSRFSSKATDENKKSGLCDVVKKAKFLSKNKFIDYKLKMDKEFDRVLNLKVDLDAKDALELWLKIIDETEPKYKKTINVEWTGKFDVTEDEFVEYSVDIMLKSDNGPKIVDDFDVSAALNEDRKRI